MKTGVYFSENLSDSATAVSWFVRLFVFLLGCLFVFVFFPFSPSVMYKPGKNHALGFGFAGDTEFEKKKYL